MEEEADGDEVGGVGGEGGCGGVGVGIGEGEDDGVGRHGHDHVGGDGAAFGEAEENVGADQGIAEGAGFGRGGEAVLIFVHAIGAAGEQHALGVAHEDVLAADA